MLHRSLLFVFMLSMTVFTQVPPVEPGVSQTLAKWRAARYSDVRYKLNLKLEKMSPVLKGTIEIRVKVTSQAEPPASAGGGTAPAETRPVGNVPPIILDWRKIKDFEERSTINNVIVNGKAVVVSSSPPANADGSAFEHNEHLIFRDGVVAGENVIKLDFTSPILTSGSAITRYVDKEDGAEYIYSLFVPSDASTAFPVFDQPDLKARFQLSVKVENGWTAVSNTPIEKTWKGWCDVDKPCFDGVEFAATKPISTYVFAFAAGPFTQHSYQYGDVMKSADETYFKRPKGADAFEMSVYVRKSQAAKFKPHAAEVFRLNREGIKYLETYFDYKFPFPKYDIVLIPEFPFGGMEHAGATFLREASVIFPQEPTKNDYISRANLIFHEAAHQWFGDTVTMKWFDDLWLKEGFAEFMAYKTLEAVMPEYNARKVFYERNKQAAYLTDSTKGTTPIYQEIANLNSAKSAYGNIVYRKAPSFLRQAEFYLGEDKFQTAVRGFLKKHEFANAGWEDLVKDFETASGQNLKVWADDWVTKRGMGIYSSPPFGVHKSNIRLSRKQKILLGIDPNKPKPEEYSLDFNQNSILGGDIRWGSRIKFMISYRNGESQERVVEIQRMTAGITLYAEEDKKPLFIFPNYQDYGYGIFLLDDKSRDYVLKNIQNEKDDFLRTMMWGSLWDSVREGELDPKEYVELVIKNLSTTPSAAASSTPPNQGGESDESTIATLLGRVSTAMTYYLPTGQAEPPALAGGKKPSAKSTSGQPASTPPAHAGGSALGARLETILIDRMQNAPTLGQRITYYRALLNIAASKEAQGVLRAILASNKRDERNSPGFVGMMSNEDAERIAKFEAAIRTLPIKTKDKFDIVTRLAILGDPDAANLLAELEKTETSDDAKRYAYAAKAGIGTAENKAKYWNDFTANKEISESWIEAAFGPWNSIRHSDLTLPYLERALKELPNHKRTRKIFFVNGWLASFIGGQRSEEALTIVNKFLTDNPNLDKDLRLKILENVDLIERAVKIRSKYR